MWPMGLGLIIIHFLQDVPNRHLNYTYNSANDNYYAYLICQIALSDDIDAFMCLLNLIDLIERSFQREGSLYLACNDRNAGA